MHPRRLSSSRPSILSTAVAALLTAGAALWLPTTAAAATITWGTPTTISADADVSNTGSTVGAYLFGDGTATGTTVNGVSFTAVNFTKAANVALTAGNFSFVTTDVGGLFP